MGLLVIVIIAILALLLLGPVITGLLDLAIALIVWMIIGYLAGRLMRGRGYGALGDILLGLSGGLVGSFLFSLLNIRAGGIIGNIIVGVIGAVVLVYAVRALFRSDFAR